MQLSLFGIGEAGAGRTGWKFTALETALERRRMDFGGGAGVSAQVKASISLLGGAKIGAPGKSTVRLGMGILAITALAFCEVNFSAARGGKS